MTQEEIEEYKAEHGGTEPEGQLRTTKAQRTGCSMCGFGVHIEKRPNRFDQLRHRNPKEWEMWMNHICQDETGNGTAGAASWTISGSDGKMIFLTRRTRNRFVRSAWTGWGKTSPWRGRRRHRKRDVLELQKKAEGDQTLCR